MSTKVIEKRFSEMGAHVRCEESRNPNFSSINIRSEGSNETFLLTFNPETVFPEVVDVDRSGRHLLLMLREVDPTNGLTISKNKFLCGHDERHWFTAAVPNRSRDVSTAKEALKPSPVTERESKVGIRKKNRNKRKNKAWKRQGEWFFIPSNVKVPKAFILKNEPLLRGRGSSPHICQEAYRRGGELVYTCYKFPTGLTEGEYRNHLKKNPEDKTLPWRTFTRNPEVFVRGTIRHSDHATITLDGWHKVEMNEEINVPHARNVAFLD